MLTWIILEVHHLQFEPPNLAQALPSHFDTQVLVLAKKWLVEGQHNNLNHHHRKNHYYFGHCLKKGAGVLFTLKVIQLKKTFNGTFAW